MKFYTRDTKLFLDIMLVKFEYFIIQEMTGIFIRGA